MKILLLGANGQVGHELRRSFSGLGDIVVTTRDGALDGHACCEIANLEQPDSLPEIVNRIDPDVVVNAAAYTAVDRAEDEPGLAYLVNAEAPARLAQVCALRGALLVHYSTDYVFDGGSARPYREDDAIGPLGVYGASKLAGEQAIARAEVRHVIFRTAWVYGNHGNNFMRTMLRLGAERSEMRVVADQIGTPTPARLIADVTAQVLRTQPQASGIWHLTAAGQTSWHGFAQEIFEQAILAGRLSVRPVVIPIGTHEYPTRARRPAYSCLDTARLREQFRIELPEWQSGLADVLSSPGES